MKKTLLMIGFFISLSRLAFAQSATILPNSSDFLNDNSADYSYAIRGILTSLAPGIYTAAVRGENKGTNDKGIGVWGSHDGGGWGVFGSSETGMGTVGRSMNGIGLNGISLNGSGLVTESATGNAAVFNNTNSANKNETVKINTNGKGVGLDIAITNPLNSNEALKILHSGKGSGIYVEGLDYAMKAKSTTALGATILADNELGIGIIGRNKSTTYSAAAVVGQNESSGAGIRGFNTGTGIGILGQSKTNYGVKAISETGTAFYAESTTGRAGYFVNIGDDPGEVVYIHNLGKGHGLEIDNLMPYNEKDVLKVVTQGTGAGINVAGSNSDGDGAGLVVGKKKPYTKIFTTNPQVDFEVRHPLENTMGMSGLRILNTGPNLSNWTFYSVNNNGDLILYADGVTKGIFNGNTGAYTTVSDKRLKTNIKDYNTTLANIMKMEVKSYQRFNSNKNEVGLMAQDALKYFPEIVYDNTNDKGEQFYTMDYSRIGVIAIKAVQEQQTLIDKQQVEIKELQKQLKKQEAAIELLTNTVNKLINK
ncbi:tail fiber domain-containing protein [Emticicia sp. C21]|uniref:tail fiber domain-containing protein n=1 Tax=Emticicia sp. C21 TaxID=2302915 RepID=UPI000E348044|nr:tail fiber domain-containing protein [Emticicia sp. C21]RFS17722.1 tail fiber domain-containing protein [Emticicia sp. C21]